MQFGSGKTQSEKCGKQRPHILLAARTRHKGARAPYGGAVFGFDWKRCLATAPGTTSQNEACPFRFGPLRVVEGSLSRLQSVSNTLGGYLQKHRRPWAVERGSSDVFTNVFTKSHL